MPSKPLLVWIKKPGRPAGARHKLSLEALRRIRFGQKKRREAKQAEKKAVQKATRIGDVTLVTSPVSKLLDQVRRSEDYAINVFQRNPGF